MNEKIKETISDIDELQRFLRKIYSDTELAKIMLIKIAQIVTNEVPEDNIKEVLVNTNNNISSRAILTYMASTIGAVSREDIKNHFRCKSEDLALLNYLLQAKRIVRDGINDKGYTKYSLASQTVGV